MRIPLKTYYPAGDPAAYRKVIIFDKIHYSNMVLGQSIKEYFQKCGRIHAKANNKFLVFL